MIKLGELIPVAGGLTQTMNAVQHPEPSRPLEAAAPDSQIGPQGPGPANPLAGPATVPEQDPRGQRDPNHRPGQEGFAAALRSAGGAKQDGAPPIRTSASLRPVSVVPDILADRPNLVTDGFAAEEAARQRMRGAAEAAPATPDNSGRKAALAYLDSEVGIDPLAPGFRVDRRA
jgi:hypothetical protein